MNCPKYDTMAKLYSNELILSPIVCPPSVFFCLSICCLSISKHFTFFTAPQAQTEMVLVCSVCYELLMNQADREKQSWWSWHVADFYRLPAYQYKTGAPRPRTWPPYISNCTLSLPRLLLYVHIFFHCLICLDKVTFILV